MRVKPSWMLDAAIIVVGLIAVALLVFSTRLTSTTLDRNSAWNQAIGTLKVNLALSNGWLVAAGSGQARVDAQRHVFESIDAAGAQCSTLVVTGAPEAARLCDRLASFRSLAAQRLQGKQARAYDAAFATTLRLADEAQHSIGLKIAEKRTALNRIDAGIALLVLIAFAVVAIVVARRVKQLADHNEHLRRLDQLKDNVLAAVSHELRTPLTSTIGFLQTLERSDVELGEDERHQLLTIARLQAQRLGGLVDDLLFCAQAERGEVPLRCGQVDVSTLSADCVRAAEANAREKGVSIQLNAEPVPSVRADRARLAQLLDNLLSNALKFTPRGGRVEVRTAATGERVLLEVSDTGMGIPASEQPHLFDRFFRTAAAVEQAIPGTGLGLTIVKAIVDAHKGVVTVRSEEAHGTTVRVELPLPA
jgi:signal transduction histidine kinase